MPVILLMWKRGECQSIWRNSETYNLVVILLLFYVRPCIITSLAQRGYIQGMFFWIHTGISRKAQHLLYNTFLQMVSTAVLFSSTSLCSIQKAVYRWYFASLRSPMNIHHSRHFQEDRCILSRSLKAPNELADTKSWENNLTLPANGIRSVSNTSLPHVLQHLLQ